MDGARKRILLVEDDLALAELVREFLEQGQYEVLLENRGDRAADHIIQHAPDLVILDVMLPGLDGTNVCRQVRPQYRGPIMMLTARTDDIDEIVGLEVGADDYLKKPVRPRVLLARIGALLRRRGTPAALDELVVGPIRVAPAARTVTVAGLPIELTSAEFDLLEYMMHRPGRPLSREELSRDLRGISYDGSDRTIDLRVAHLRSKLGDDAKHPRLIKSVRGIGYQLVQA